MVPRRGSAETAIPIRHMNERQPSWTTNVAVEEADVAGDGELEPDPGPGAARVALRGGVIAMISSAAPTMEPTESSEPPEIISKREKRPRRHARLGRHDFRRYPPRLPVPG